MTNIAIFASGNGSNAERIITYFKNHAHTKVVCIVSDHQDAIVLDRAKKLNVPSYIFSGKQFKEGTEIIKLMQELKIDFIILAGFLRLIPENFIHIFPNRIINIHPALLPDFGGKGMYGENLFRTVLDSGEKESGITIHYVNENYDKGEIIFQTKCLIDENETIDTLEKKIHKLEYEHYPKIIEKLINN